MNFFRKTGKVANEDDAPKRVVGADQGENDTCNDEKVMADANKEGKDVNVATAAATSGIEEANEGNVAAPAAADSDEERLDSVPLDSSSSHKEDQGEESNPKDEEDGIDSEGEHSEDDDDHDDDDSEYTYETVEDDDDEGEGGKNKKRGWFGFLKRDKKGAQEEDEEEEEYTDESEEEEEEQHSDDDESEGEEDKDKGEEEELVDNHEEEEDDSSSDDEILNHHLLNSPDPPKPTLTLHGTAITVPPIPEESATAKAKKEEEEAILMAQAIQRVQHRIQSNGGNLYDALDENDKQLVDSLRGEDDEEVIKKVVAESMEMEEKPIEQVDQGGVDAETLETEKDEASVTVTHDVIESTDVSHNHKEEEMVHVDDVGEEEENKEEEQQQQQEEEAGSHDGNFDQEEEDDDDDDQPTLEEQRSLLSLAAEHDRVDVIKELLQDASLFDTLLAGISHNGDYEPANEQDDEATFVPPPLHASVAHGSINAASCLLRMGADPSIRPMVPPAYLHPNYQPSPLKRSGSGMNEDRNYKKYHDMSAWELAFGATVVVEDGDVMDGGADEEVVEEETSKKGWFGFGSPSKKEEHDESADNSAIENVGASSKQRVKRKQPLNIPPAKIEGIKHAFTAEALRAIGSDEAQRLAQLLNAGMDSSMEVMPGKTLVCFAKDMDAQECCELLRPEIEDEANEEEEEVLVDVHVDADTEDVNQTKMNGGGGQNDKEEEAGEAPMLVENSVETPPQPAAIQDERLSGFSLADIQTLVRENENLLPHLTACHDDLADETFIFQSILRDIQATAGKGGLSSQALLELVRTLKDQRAQAEEAANEWQNAWEEREDELDFFWEEVLNEELRAELGGVLDQITDDPMRQGMTRGSASPTSLMEEWAHRFIEADDRANSLRASIANLAEESAQLSAEIERHGMSGALSLTRSLREEVKESEKDLELARAGEEACRRKIETIQGRLDGYHGAEVDGLQVHQEQVQEEEGHYPEAYPEERTPPMSVAAENGGMEDYQLSAIVQQQEQHQHEQMQQSAKEKHNPSSPVVKLKHVEVDQGAPKYQVSPSANDSSIEAQHEEERQVHLSRHNIPTDNLLDNDSSSNSEEIVVEDVDDEESMDEEESVDDDQHISGHDYSSQSDVEDMDESIDESNDIIEEISGGGDEAQDEECDAPVVEVVQHPSEAEPSPDPTIMYDPDGNTLHPNKTHLNAVGEEASSDMNVRPATITNQQREPPTTIISNQYKPSDAITEGMSTAIVVHNPQHGGNSLGSQIWDILKRIVGFGQVVPVPNSRSGSYHDDLIENNPHIMIV